MLLEDREDKGTVRQGDRDLSGKQRYEINEAEDMLQFFLVFTGNMTGSSVSPCLYIN